MIPHVLRCVGLFCLWFRPLAGVFSKRGWGWETATLARIQAQLLTGSLTIFAKK